MAEVLNDDPMYKGCVIGYYIENFIEDSYDNMVYIDPETGIIAIEETGYVNDHAPYRVDITEENFKAFLKHADKRYIEGAIERDRANAHAITKGKYVEVLKGRKVPLHTKGNVFWTKEQEIRDRWGRIRDVVTRVGLKDADGKVWWTYASNCVVINPKTYYTPAQVLRKQIKEYKSEAYKRVVMRHQMVYDRSRQSNGYRLGNYWKGNEYLIY
ncbi:MAG: hypothetical protein LUE27_06895 [Clostridia bacterium]|nr:hypothetical protein [Clostridia bacterium]